ncbi:high affinity copper uptake protein 1-like isoform X2 [Varroa destructor]|uniref:Copper transport protein n=1 Tax=Varroa destructor TaxID=109461 RepID=A0A7M7M6V7_VARDE|nr:high affinity copper uptake protein 1-like isoform X2 [Varroa destructor]
MRRMLHNKMLVTYIHPKRYHQRLSYDQMAHAGHTGRETAGQMTGDAYNISDTHTWNMMHMAFYASTNSTILFSDWKITNARQMVGACVGVFVMAMLFEALRTFRERLRSRSRGDSKTSLISQSRQWTSALMDPSHLVQTMLYGFQITLGYLLMLIFMTYNVYICLAVVSGATLGFWLFSWRKCPMFDITVEHCG